LQNSKNKITKKW